MGKYKAKKVNVGLQNTMETISGDSKKHQCSLPGIDALLNTTFYHSLAAAKIIACIKNC